VAKFIHTCPTQCLTSRGACGETIGISDVDELYEDIPQELRFRGDMNLPDPLPPSRTCVASVNSILSKNRTCEENISFLGGGCARHYVPAICDEINQRSEFLSCLRR